MADNGSGGDKTEKASSQKLRKAREQGQVVRSKDLTTAVGILASLKLLVFLMPDYLESFRALFRMVFVPLGETGAIENALSIVFGKAAMLLIEMLLPLFGVTLAVLLSSLVPGGWTFSSASLAPNFGRFSPVKNLGNLASAKHWSTFAISVAKAILLAAVLWYVVRSGAASWLDLQRLPLSDALLRGASQLFDALMALVSVFLLFALIDVPLQSFLFARSQRMSKQEVKEEYKSTEGKPEVKQRIRQIQQQLARRNVNKTVPTADVVIVNPEHYAVALKYDTARAEAPFVVAKGIDEMALYIKAVAVRHRIETVTLPPLARAIYNTSQVQQQIPAQLYQAVSQVLNYVLQLNAFRDGRRQAPPRFPNEVFVPSQLSEVSAT
jgi:flagellar biosynthesis protein FlhB